MAYLTLDATIEATYATRSTASSKRTLYDAYIRAIKWASLRIGDRGVIGYVSNGGWLDSNSADGLRLTLADEFSDIHVFNLRGNARTGGDQRKREGGTVFGGGSRAAVAITLFVKDPSHAGPARIHYTDIGDYLTREQKLADIASTERMRGRRTVTHLTPNHQGDWLLQRRDDFGEFLPLGDRGNTQAIFRLYSLGLATGRDAWVVASSKDALRRSVETMIVNYNALVEGKLVADRDPRRISWNRNLEQRFVQGRRLPFAPDAAIRTFAYRPFVKQSVYFDRALNAMVYRLNEVFPTAKHVNYGFVIMAPRPEAEPAALMVGEMPDLSFYTYTGQFFARWRYEEALTDDGRLPVDAAEDGELVDGYRRIDNITDATLATFRTAYGESISKDDVFFYVYGLLHSPDYRETYRVDLKKMLPRIPAVTDPWPFVAAGRRLSELHLGYEGVEPHPLEGLDVEGPAGDSAYDFFRVEKMAFAKVRDAQSGKLVADRSRVVYNSNVTLSGIPEEAHRYQLGSRSAIEWIIDRYQVKTDKPSGIVNDPNEWSRDVGNPRYILDLLARIVTVSLETMKIVDGLPALDIRADQEAGVP